MHFQFATAGQIRFGTGVLAEAGPAAKEFGTRALVVVGRDQNRAAPLLKTLRESRVGTTCFSVAGEPEIATVNEGAALARRRRCGLIISFGGGSAIDAGKAIAAILTNPGDVLDYLEVIGGGHPLAKPAAPFVAIPTTAGTGSEVTRNAVLASPEHQVKVSLRSPFMLPRLALVDPELTYELPPAITARTGLDAMTQLIEPYVSIRANPLTDSLCIEGLTRASRALPRAFKNGSDTAARADMALAALFGGLALANAGLGAVHGFAGPFGGRFAAPHGAVCAALLPHVMRLNLLALQQRQPSSEAHVRYTRIARLLTGISDAKAEDGIAWIRRLITDLQIPPLGAYGLEREHVPELVKNAAMASSMKANPIALLPEEMEEALERAR
jgi:alcohol dehydrogenase class IV